MHKFTYLVWLRLLGLCQLSSHDGWIDEHFSCTHAVRSFKRAVSLSLLVNYRFHAIYLSRRVPFDWVVVMHVRDQSATISESGYGPRAERFRGT